MFWFFISKIFFIFNFCKKSYLKFDIYPISFINCMPKVLLIICDILTSQLVFYLFNIGMTQLIHHLFNKNGGGLKFHIAFSMEIFVTIVYGFLTVAVVVKSYLIAGVVFMDLFLKNILLRFKLLHKWKMLTVYIL